jgi:hypothetical protein
MPVANRFQFMCKCARKSDLWLYPAQDQHVNLQVTVQARHEPDEAP